MRTIKFRGQRVDNGEWVYGDLMHYVMGEDQLVYTTSIRSAIIYYVKPETVGQFTGLQDKKGVDIYEGDILFLQESPNSHHYIEYCSERCCFTDIRIEDGESNTDHYGFEFVKDCEVIGNEFNNPELLNK